MSKFLQTPVAPFEAENQTTVADLVSAMGKTAFQARNVAQATGIWQQMCQEKTLIFFGLAGAMVPAGMRRLVSLLIKERLIDCVVSTGANLLHDIHETLGYYHWQGCSKVDDDELCKEDINRIYDVFADEKEFFKTDVVIEEFANNLDQDRSYTTREFLFLLGKHLGEAGKTEGILTLAAQYGVPVYCAAIGDSSIGIAIAEGRKKKKNRLMFDIIQDIVELADLAGQITPSGVIYVGGGTPKNFIQQAEVTAKYMGYHCLGHKYAIQITADAPHWGGLSGCTFDEGKSWGKIAPKAEQVTVFSDATIALPLIVTALLQNLSDRPRRKVIPKFELGGREIKIAKT